MSGHAPGILCVVHLFSCDTYAQPLQRAGEQFDHGLVFALSLAQQHGEGERDTMFVVAKAVRDRPAGLVQQRRRAAQVDPVACGAVAFGQ